MCAAKSAEVGNQRRKLKQSLHAHTPKWITTQRWLEHLNRWLHRVKYIRRAYSFRSCIPSISPCDTYKQSKAYYNGNYFIVTLIWCAFFIRVVLLNYVKCSKKQQQQKFLFFPFGRWNWTTLLVLPSKQMIASWLIHRKETTANQKNTLENIATSANVA